MSKHCREVGVLRGGEGRLGELSPQTRVLRFVWHRVGASWHPSSWGQSSLLLPVRLTHRAFRNYQCALHAHSMPSLVQDSPWVILHLHSSL